MTKSRGIYNRVVLPRRMQSILDHELVQPEPNCGCWLWTGTRTKLGYGRLTYQGANCKAHRLAWELANGPIPSGMGILHRCNNPSCVNPDHLYPGNQAQNYHDMVRAGRDKCVLRGEDRPDAKLTEEQVLAIRSDSRSCSMVAREYGMNKSTINHIRTRRRWAHI